MLRSKYFSQQKRFQRLKHIWRSRDVRQSFIDFYKHQHDHTMVPSSSVIPKKGEGTYFTNAGMNQFKPLFLGAVPPGSVMADYKRVVNSQKCIRVGGKHNDLDDVGHDLSHHTFFEMLGNWSFGDYFKMDACKMAYQLLTDVYKLPPERLYFTYFKGNEQLNLQPDLQSKTIWLQLGIPESHILPFGMKDNFWDMGETGPCGPCSEIHYDHIGKEDSASLVNTGSPDVVEIWNLVFMQFNRQADQSLRPLASHHVDTGMGLERICAILNGSKSNYNTDLFSPLFQTIHKLSKVPAYCGLIGEEDKSGLDTAYRILADHTRMLSMSIADGLLPDRGGLGHKLRQIIHRCIQQSTDVFHCDKTLLLSLVDDVTESLGETYSELVDNNKKIKEVISMTEDTYIQNKEKGLRAFNKMLKKHSEIQSLSGSVMYELHAGRFGFHVSVDLILDLAKAKNIKVDLVEFENILQNEQGKSDVIPDSSRQNQLLTSDVIDKFKCEYVTTDDSYKYHYTFEHGQYVFERPDEVRLKCIVHNGELVDQLKQGQTGYVVLDKTCFYSESGGQTSDKGQIITKNGFGDIVDVRSFRDYILHQVRVSDGRIQIDDISDITLNEEVRMGCMLNHTATHLLNSALRQVLVNTQQNGSVIQPHKFTFDFLSVGSLSLEDIQKIEYSVRCCIQDGHPVQRQLMSLTDAMNLPGIVSLQNEDYFETVSVIKVGDAVSTELCGGTHVCNTGDIVEFCIIKLSGVSQGTKRVTCVTGKQAMEAVRNKDMLVDKYNHLEQMVKSGLKHDIWSEQVKDIYKVLNLELLPKVERDTYQVKTDQLQFTIKTELNKQTVENIKQLIDAACTGNLTKSFITITDIPTNDTKLISKSIKLSSSVKPMLLISGINKKSTLIICLPEKSVPADFHPKLKKMVQNTNIAANISIKDQELYVISFKSELSSDGLVEFENSLTNVIPNS